MVVLPWFNHMVNRVFTMVNHVVELPYPRNHGSRMVFLVGYSRCRLQRGVWRQWAASTSSTLKSVWSPARRRPSRHRRWSIDRACDSAETALRPLTSGRWRSVAACRGTENDPERRTAARLRPRPSPATRRRRLLLLPRCPPSSILQLYCVLLTNTVTTLIV